MKTKIEGVSFQIGDRVKFNINSHYRVNETVEDYLKDLYYWAFDRKPRNIDPDATFKVARIKIDTNFDGGIGVKISNGKKVSTWLIRYYLKKA